MSQYKYTLLKKSVKVVSLSLSLSLRRCYLGGQEIIETGCSILSAGSSRCEHPHLLVNALENKAVVNVRLQSPLHWSVCS